MINVVIIDDDPLVSGSLKIILESKDDSQEEIVVKETFSSGREIVSYISEGNDADILLMDIRMDDINGLEATEKILSIKQDIKIIFLTTFLDDEYISKALSVGAYGYVLKQDCASLPQTVRAVSAGQKVYGSKIVDKLPDILNQKTAFDYASRDISERELDVIKLVADGLSNKEIADRLFLGEGTVRNIVSTALSKLELRDRTQLAIFYLTH